jgi:outer membrane protein assembly factor BamB
VTPLVLQLNDDDGDGVITGCDIPDVVVVEYDAPDGHLIAMSGDTGAVHWDITDPCFNVSPFGAIAGGDINNDGLNEIVVVNQNRYVCAVSSDGSILWETPQPIPGSTGAVSPVPQIWDLDGDGTAEIIIERTVLRGVNGSGTGIW